MYQRSWAHAQRGGQRGRVWARFPLCDIPECGEEIDDEAKYKAGKDPMKRPEGVPKIIITTPSEDGNAFYEWHESSSDSELDNSDDDESSEAVKTEVTNIDEVPKVHRVKRQRKRKPRSFLTLEKAGEFVNEVISTGLHPWEFKWSTGGDRQNPYRVGWSKVIPRVSSPVLRRRASYVMQSRNSPHSSAKTNSGGSSQDERGYPRRKNKVQEPVNVIFGPWKSTGPHAKGKTPRDDKSGHESEVGDQKWASPSDIVDDLDTDMVFFGEYGSDLIGR